MLCHTFNLLRLISIFYNLVGPWGVYLTELCTPSGLVYICLFVDHLLKCPKVSNDALNVIDHRTSIIRSCMMSYMDVRWCTTSSITLATIITASCILYYNAQHRTMVVQWRASTYYGNYKIFYCLPSSYRQIELPPPISMVCHFCTWQDCVKSSPCHYSIIHTCRN